MGKTTITREKNGAHKLKGNNPATREINQMESFGDYLQEEVTSISKAFPGIDGVTKKGRVFSQKNI